MTNHDYLTLIERGIESWNRWREENPGVKPDLSRCYLFEANLSGANLSGVNLNRACLIGANLKGANLRRANLNGAYASGANFSNANLNGADLSSANFSEADLIETDLSGANAKGTDFTSACLTGVCLQGWSINSATRFKHVKCQYVYLRSQQRERHPSRGEFSAEEFLDVFQAAMHGVAGGKSTESTGTGLPKKELAPAKPPIAVSSATRSPSVPASSSLNAAPKASPERSLATPTLVAMEMSISQTSLAPSVSLSHSQPMRQRVMVGTAALTVIFTASAIFVSTFSQAPVSVSLESTPHATIDLPPLPCDELPPSPLLHKIPDYKYNDGSKFYGEFADGLPADGRGTMVFSNGDRYDGEYKNGSRNGCGTFTFANRRQYVGQFQSDQFQGMGIWKLENGDRYIGEFQDNKCNGRGTYLFADRSFKVGMWQDGELVGGNLSCN
jgi:hypothetical protein